MQIATMPKLCIVSKSSVNTQACTAIPEFRMDEEPSGNTWNLVPLYKEPECLMYQIGYEHGSGVLRITQEITDAEFQHTHHDITQDTRTPAQIARAMYCAQYMLRYRSPGGDVPTLRIMKADIYPGESFWKRNHMVYTQAKIHGIRMLARAGLNGSITKYSALANVFTNLSHLDADIQSLAPYLPKNFTLDGELYVHGMPFSTLTSAVRTQHTQHPRLLDVQYWIFDIDYEYSDTATTFDERYKLLVGAVKNYMADTGSALGTLTIVPCELAQSHADILAQHNAHVRAGYEGVILRKIGFGLDSNSQQYKAALYKHGRCVNVLKYKLHTDEEATVLSVNGAEITVKLNPQPQKVMKLQAPGLHSDNLNESLVGKLLTIKYTHTSHDGTPVDAQVMAIRDYE